MPEYLLVLDRDDCLHGGVMLPSDCLASQRMQDVAADVRRALWREFGETEDYNLVSAEGEDTLLAFWDAPEVRETLKKAGGEASSLIVTLHEHDLTDKGPEEIVTYLVEKWASKHTDKSTPPDPLEIDCLPETNDLIEYICGGGAS